MGNQQPKNYLIGQRLTYLILGVVVGYFFSLNQQPIKNILFIVFVVIGTILAFWFRKKNK